MLRELIGADILRISSSELAGRMKLTPSQIRQDFSYLGGVGQQGYGYNVKDLIRRCRYSSRYTEQLQRRHNLAKQLSLPQQLPTIRALPCAA